MADNISQGIRISINTQDITKVRQDFNKLVESLKKQADKPIDFKVNTIGIQEQLKKTASSVEEVVNTYKSLGNVNIKPLNFDKEGNLTKFKVLLEQNNGLIDAITYKANKYVDSSSKIKPVSFEIQGIKEFDNSENMLKDIARAEEILANAEKQSREEINNAIQSTINKRKEEEQLLAQSQDKAINKGIGQEIKDREKIQDAISKTINQRKTEDNILDDNQSKAINKVLDDNFSSIQSFQKKQQSILNNIKNDYKNIFEPSEIIEFENALTRLSPKSETLENDFSQLENKIKSFKNSLASQQYNDSLGKKVETKTPFNFNADSETIKKYVKEIVGVDAEFTKLTPKVDKFGNNLKEVSVRVKEGQDKWKNYAISLLESDGSIRKLDKGLTDVSSKVVGLGDKLKAGLQSMGLFIGATSLLYGTINKLKEGISTVNQINKSQTNILMIASDEVSKYEGGIKGLTNTYRNMAKDLHATNTEILSGAENFLRAGRSIEETKSLLETSTIGSKISGQSVEQTSEQLIAIGNGLDITTDKMIDVVDKMSYIDNTSATSFSELATAMQYTSASAKNVGTTFDQLLSYIGTVSSVSRRSAETIGQSFKTIFARFEDVKQGKTLDAEGETISNVEQSLNQVGIALRKDKDTFRDFNDVIDDLAKKWKGLTDLQKADITKSLAG